jgi:hypothetical protein
MTRDELVRRFVLNEITDDYEEPQHIYESIAKYSPGCGLYISMQEVTEGIADLIRAGLARAYRLTPTSRSAEEIEGVPTSDQMSNLYFCATPKGMELQSSDPDWYPFDDSGGLRKDWTPPTP